MRISVYSVSQLVALMLLCQCGGVETNRDFIVPANLFPPQSLSNQLVDPATTRGGDAFPQTYDSANAEEGNIGLSQLIGYVHSPIATVWASVKKPEVLADNRIGHTETFSSTECPIDADFVYCMVLINHLTITALDNKDLRFDVMWKHHAKKDNDDNLEEINVVFQAIKVDPDNLGAISTLEGRYVLTAVTPTITRVWMYYRLLVAQRSSKLEAEANLQLVYCRIRRDSHPEFPACALDDTELPQ